MSEKRTINLSRTTDDQLMKLANSLGVKVDQIDFKQHLDRSKDYCIINMGNPMIGGKHWTAVSNKDKFYFYPLGLPRPRVIPSNYKYREVDIQDPRFGHCGQWTVLFVYYLQHGKVDNFYKLLRVAGFWYCVPVTGQPKPVQSEPTLITPPRITPLLIMPPVGTRL
ncbi:unnamed protein product [Phytophthora lilii]|uniref:Unnamed protein product n=1 Tax=Phytophthora lilii TaxID=2077276 RepID=A0A9W6Y5A2_9STRA|nr:unnamed protein product [Phytophthora lilii]